MISDNDPNLPIETLYTMPSQKGYTQQLQLVYHLRKYILEHINYFSFDIERDKLGIALSTTYTILSETVKTITGKTLMEYINLVRLEKARQMLENNPEQTVKAIAEECGFNHRAFIRLFREHYSFSPSKYRKMAGKVEE